ncbi:MAG: iron-sulfur cluster assembly scaffold protein [Planctomycetota bacterium]|nr:iron-sulfur cluster assembly scaffold protein [Planctomycetota bacterium]
MSLSTELSEHLMSPRHVGELQDVGGAVGRGQGENQACGDVLVVEARFAPGLELAWRAQSCGAVIAVASLAAACLQGLGRDEVATFDLAARIEAAGGLDRRGAHAIKVFERALAAALAQA